MPQPPQYTRITSFSADEANNLTGRSTVRTTNLNTEFDNAKLTLDQLVTNAGLIQRDDGKLLDGVVTQASLSVAVTALFVAAGANPRGAWLTVTAYAVKDIIETGAPIAPYMCVTAHTSGVFATDYAAGKWLVLGSGLPTDTQISVTPTGGVGSTNVQTAIAELDSEKVAKASNGNDFANIATTRDNLSVFSRAEGQTLSYVVATAAGTFDAITASFTPAITTLTNGQILFVRAIGANTITNPTFTPNSGVVAVKTIKKLNNIALAISDISGSGHVMILQYNITIDAWFLLNLSSSIFPTFQQLRTNGPLITAEALVSNDGGQINLERVVGNVVSGLFAIDAVSDTLRFFSTASAALVVWDMSGATAKQTAGVVPLARMQRASYRGGNPSSSLTVVAGDIISVSGMFNRSNTAGVTTVSASLGRSGTATVIGLDGVVTLLASLHCDFAVVGTSVIYQTISGIFEVTVGGTIVFNLTFGNFGAGVGSTASNGIHVIVLAGT